MAFHSGGDYSVKFDARRQKLSFQLQLQAQLVLADDQNDTPQPHHHEKMCSRQASEWGLVDQLGRRFPLPHTMIFLGREECDITIQSRSVDKRHAVLTHDSYEGKFKVKDLSSLNGTFVNDTRIPEQAYVTLEHLDSVRFGYDPMVYRMERIEEVPQIEGAVLSPVTPDKTAAWTTQDKSPLAECQGCIAEQKIQHTCSYQEDSVSTHRSMHTCHGDGSSNGHHGHQQQNVWHHSAIYQSTNRYDAKSGQTYDNNVIPVSYAGSGSKNAAILNYHHNANNQTSSPQYVNEGYGRPISMSSSSSSAHQSRNNPNANMQQGDQTPRIQQNFTHQQQQEFNNSLVAAKGEIKQPTNIQRDNYQNSQQTRTSGGVVSNNMVCSPPMARRDISNNSRSGNDTNETFYPAAATQRTGDHSVLGQMAGNNAYLHSAVISPGADMGGQGARRGQPGVMGSIQLPQQISVPVEMIQNFHRGHQVAHPIPVSAAFGSNGANPEARFQGDGYPMATIDLSSAQLHPHLVFTNNASASSSSTATMHHQNYVYSQPMMTNDQQQKYVNLSHQNHSINVHDNNRSHDPALRHGGAEHAVLEHSLAHGRTNNTVLSPPPRSSQDQSYPVLHVQYQNAVIEDSLDAGGVGPSGGGTQNQAVMSPGLTSGGNGASAEAQNRHDHRRSISGAENDLETVKKGTPLYGQPSWWGEGEDGGETDTPPLPDGQQKLARQQQDTHYQDDKSENNANDVRSGISVASEPNVATSSKSRAVEAHPKPTYMEIPTHGSDHTPEEGEVSPPLGTAETQPEGSPDANASLNTSGFAFTVEFGSERDEAKKLNMNESLSKFLPHKVRRSFRERQAKSVPRDKEDEPLSVIEKIEEKEAIILSPTRNKRTEEICDSPTCKKPPKSPRSAGAKVTAGYLSDGNNEVLSASSDNEDISVQSDIITSPDKFRKRQSVRSSLKQRLQIERVPPDSKVAKTSANVAEKKSISKYRQKAPSSGTSGSRVIQQKTSSQKSSSSTKTTEGATKQREHSPANSKNRSPSAYLIDKMFEGQRQKKEHEANTETRPRERRDSKSSAVNPSSPRSTSGVPRPRKSSTEPTTSRTPTKSPRQTKTRKESTGSNPAAATPNEDDKVSEAGTYTIGSEGPTADLEEARRSIDQVFGVTSTDDPEAEDANNSLSYSRPVITDELPHVYEEEGGDSGDDVGEIPSDSMDVEVGTDGDKYSEGTSPLPTSNAPKWVTQWASLTSQRAGHTDQDAAPNTVHVSNKDKLQLKSHQNAADSKRANLRRKLPKPQASEGNATRRTSPGVGNQAASGRKTSSQSVNRESGEMLTNRSTGSIDTAILLQDTEQVVAALAARNSQQATSRQHRRTPGNERVNSKSLDYLNDDCCSDSDTSSTAVVLNGRRGGGGGASSGSTRPSHSNNTRTENKKPATRPSSGRNDVRPITTKEKVLMHLASKSGVKPKTFYCPSDPGDGGYDNVSESDYGQSDTASLYSNNTEMSESSPKLGRKAAQSKGAISMTRPNRAFALRRARLEAEAAAAGGSNKSETSDVPSSAKSSTRTSSRPASAGRERPVRDQSGERRRPASAKVVPDSARSLGTEIVKRSQDNMRAERDKNFMRADGGRFSLRGTRSGSVSSVTSTTSVTSNKQPIDLKTIKSKLKAQAKPSSSMHVTGTSAGVQSQPVSRSSSPKSQEYSAWKRRKDYDPRKAVAEGNKAKQNKSTTGGSGSRLSRPPLRKAQSLVDNSYQDRSRHNSSFSSVSREESYNDSVLNQIPERDMSRSQEIAKASNELARDLNSLSRSVDLQEATTDRSQGNASFRSMLSSSTDRSSAFSAVPPSKSPSPLRSPSPIPTPRRHALKVREKRVQDGVCKRREWDKNESYDSLIVSSIYQLSLKLKTSTDLLLDKLREQHQLSGTPSPIDDLMNEPMESEIPAWKTANQELAGILRNMRRVEHHLQVIDKALFPTTDSGPDGGSCSRAARQQYMKEIERIRKEIVGFKPIDKPAANQTWAAGSEGSEVGSEAGDFAGDEYY